MALPSCLRLGGAPSQCPWVDPSRYRLKLRPTSVKPALALALAALLVAPACGSATDSRESTSEPAAATEAPAASAEHFTRENWDMLATDPDRHKGASVEIVGKIFVAPERDGNLVVFQMWANPRLSEWNTVVGIRSPDLRLTTGDYVRVTGSVKGKFEGENAFGVTVTVRKVEFATDETRVFVAICPGLW